MDDYNKLRGQLYSAVLENNKSKNFVDRMYNKGKYPALYDESGNPMTHKMMNVSIGGKEMVLPTVVYDDGKLKELTPQEAIHFAMTRGEYIEFDSALEARDFANNGYKEAFPKGYFSSGWKK